VAKEEERIRPQLVFTIIHLTLVVSSIIRINAGDAEDGAEHGADPWGKRHIELVMEILLNVCQGCVDGQQDVLFGRIVKLSLPANNLERKKEDSKCFLEFPLFRRDRNGCLTNCGFCFPCRFRMWTSQIISAPVYNLGQWETWAWTLATIPPPADTLR